MNIHDLTASGRATATPEQIAKLQRKIQFNELNEYRLDQLLQGKNPFHLPMDLESQAKRWRERLRRLFRIKLNLDTIRIPRHCARVLTRAIIVPEGLMFEDVLTKLQTIMGVPQDSSPISESAMTHDRSNRRQSYAIKVCDCVEATDEYMFASGRPPASVFVGQTPLEYVLHALCVFEESGLHLDAHSTTICSGASLNGVAIGFHWTDDPRMLNVAGYDLKYAMLTPATRARFVLYTKGSPD